MDLISVIVPIYKVEEYLDDCVESIVNQTYQNLEIILVDDGSPDSCPQMCDKWAEKDSRIIVLHKENGGLSDARNAGLKVATGDYIAFVDSDDWVDIRFIEFLYKLLKRHCADIAACNFCVTEKKENVRVNAKETLEVKVCNSEAALFDLIRGVGFRAVAWNKLYRAELLNNKEFVVGKLHEDEFFTYQIICRAEKLVYTEDTLYYYRQRAGSIMSTPSIKHLDVLDAYLGRLEFLRQNYPRLYHCDQLTFCKTCIRFYRESVRQKNQPMQAKIKLLRDIAGIPFKDCFRKNIKDSFIMFFSTSKWIDPLSRILEKRG